MSPIWTPLWPGRLAVPAPPTARSRSVPSGICKAGRMMPCEGDQHARKTAEAVARHSYGKLVAFLAAQTGDVARAEDALSEAFASALTDWPLHGAPQNPEGWLMAVAKRKIIDMIRRKKSSEKAAGHLRLLSEEMEAAAEASAEIPAHRL